MQARMDMPLRMHWHLLLMLGGMSLLLWGGAQASVVPCNVRELFRPDAAWSSALLLALACSLLADVTDKYDQQRSALQFLLSAERQNCAPQTAVWLRYAVPHLLAIAALAFIQWPHIRAASQQLHGQAPHASL